MCLLGFFGKVFYAYWVEIQMVEGFHQEEKSRMPILSSKKELTLNHGAPLNGVPSPFCLKAESPTSLFEVSLFSKKTSGKGFPQILFWFLLIWCLNYMLDEARKRLEKVKKDGKSTGGVN
jgi:hypothetical protein